MRLLLVVAVAACSSSDASPALPEVSLLPPLASPRETTSAFDGSLAQRLDVRVCRPAGDACTALAFLEGDRGAITLMPDGYAASIGNVVPGDKLRVAIELDAVVLDTIDVEVTDALLSNRTLPIQFWVGRTRR